LLVEAAVDCGEGSDEDLLWDDGLVGLCRLVGIIGGIELNSCIIINFGIIVTDVL
jgi:hypothetical protein